MSTFFMVRNLGMVAVLLSCLACSSNPNIAWRSETSDGLTRVRVEGYDDVPHRWGFLDGNNNLAISPRFLSAGDFSEGKASVRLYGEQKRFPGNYYPNNLHPVGYINTSGEIVIEPQFCYAQAFRNGLAMFTDFDGKRGYIDHSGKPVIPAAFDDAKSFSEGLAFVRPDRKTEYVEVVVTQKEADAHNAMFRAAPGSKMYRRAGTYMERHDRGLWGVIDQSGNFVIEPHYVSVSGSFKGGKAIVEFEGKRVRIDMNGEVFALEQD